MPSNRANKSTKQIQSSYHGKTRKTVLVRGEAISVIHSWLYGHFKDVLDGVARQKSYGKLQEAEMDFFRRFTEQTTLSDAFSLKSSNSTVGDTLFKITIWTETGKVDDKLGRYFCLPLNGDKPTNVGCHPGDELRVYKDGTVKFRVCSNNFFPLST